MWVSAFLLYYYGPIPWNPPTESLWIVFLTGAVCFLLSALFSIFVLNARAHTPVGWWVIRPKLLPGYYPTLAMHLVGFVGIGTYVSDFGRSMGDLNSFQQAFVYQSYLIRMEAENTTSYGFQVSYFGWVAIGLSLLYKSPSVWKKRILILFSLIQLVANTVFIDRTRPTWIIFTAVVLFVITSHRLNFR